MAYFRKGTKVSWRWGRGRAEGVVRETFTEDVVRTIKGKRIKRQASAADPAYLLEQKNGSRVLKSESEVRRSE
jgi:hypothetical protein